jgi:hypothetical protein
MTVECNIVIALFGYARMAPAVLVVLLGVLHSRVLPYLTLHMDIANIRPH